MSFMLNGVRFSSNDGLDIPDTADKAHTFWLVGPKLQVFLYLLRKEPQMTLAVLTIY